MHISIMLVFWSLVRNSVRIERPSVSRTLQSLSNRRTGKTILLTHKHLFPHNKRRGGEQKFGKEKASDFSR